MAKMKKKVKKSSKKFMGIAWAVFMPFPLVVLLDLLLTLKTFIIVTSIIFFAILSGIFILLNKNKRMKKDEKKGDIFFFLFTFFSITDTVLCLGWIKKGMYAYAYDGNPLMVFWQLSIVIGLIIGVLFFIYFNHDSKLFNRILVAAAVCLISAMMVDIFITNLNYALCFSEPQQCTAVIEDTDWSSGGHRGLSHCEFEVTVDGKKLDIYVSQSEFSSHKVGDTITFYKYKGAFGKSFYISESKR